MKQNLHSLTAVSEDSTSDERRIRDVKETMEFFNFKKAQTLYALVHSRRIPFMKLGKRLFFDLDEVLAAMKQNAVQGYRRS